MNKHSTKNFPSVIKTRNIVAKQAKYYNSMMKNTEKDDDLEILDKHLGYSERTLQTTQVRIYLDEAIKAPKYYRGVFDKVTSLSEGDQVVYYVSSPGGYMNGLISLIEANRMSDADILCVIVGECHSAASMFALTCPNISVSPSATMMVHYVSFGTGGKASDIRANVNHTLEFTEEYFREIYEGFLTEDEIETCINTGKELWFKSDEIISRLEVRQKHFANLDEDSESDMFPEINLK